MDRTALEIDPSSLRAQLESGARPTVVDVREAWEVQHAPFRADAMHIPLGELPHRADELSRDVPVILVCHHGVRSLQAAFVLRSLGFSDVKSLRGGTDLWSRTVDPAVKRY